MEDFVPFIRVNVKVSIPISNGNNGIEHMLDAQYLTGANRVQPCTGATRSEMRSLIYYQKSHHHIFPARKYQSLSSTSEM